MINIQYLSKNSKFTHCTGTEKVSIVNLLSTNHKYLKKINLIIEIKYYLNK